MEEYTVDERTLPGYLRHDIEEWKKGVETDSDVLDCLWGELYGSINAAYYDGEISERKADYLRQKYLF